jgi:hypothetical protein
VFETLNEGELKSNGLSNLVKEISRQYRTQAMALSCFNSDIYSENQDQKAQQKELKNVQSSQKRSEFKIVNKESVVGEEIKAIKMKPSTLSWDNRKDTLRVSQELARPHPLLAPGYKIKNVI